MAIPFLSNIDLNKNQLLNHTLHNATSNPSSPSEGQIYYNTSSDKVLVYNGSAWVNDYDHNTKGKVPFTKTDGSLTHISMINNKDMTTINGFLDHVVTQSFYMPFTNASGTAVTTVRPGHMPELSEI